MSEIEYKKDENREEEQENYTIKKIKKIESKFRIYEIYKKRTRFLVKSAQNRQHIFVDFQ